MRSGVLLVFCLIFVQDVTALNQALRDYFLKMHNDHRSQLALGKIKNKNGTLLPSASNMYELKYSLAVEKIAQDWANGCKIDHKVIDGTTNNLFAEHPYKDFTDISKTAANAWMNELKNNGLKSLNFSMEVIETKVGHWVEMNWHDVKELGCGIANCAHAEKANPTDQWTFVVCEYNPGGNYINELVYKPGTPCSDCTAYPNSKCNKSTGLCYIEDETTQKPSTKKASSAKTTLISTSSTGSTISTKAKKPTRKPNDNQRVPTRLSKTLNPTVLTTPSSATGR